MPDPNLPTPKTLGERLADLLEDVDDLLGQLSDTDLPPGLRQRLDTDLRTARVGLAAAVEDLNRTT
jgi:hypothetical protein